MESTAQDSPTEKSIFVTGGAGFIGSHLCDRLVSSGNSVLCYDNFDPFYEAAIKWRNLDRVHTSASLTLVEGDVCCSRSLVEALVRSQATQIVHLAAKAGVRPSFAEPAEYHRVNVCGTINVLEAARQAGIQRVVIASSSSVYGNSLRIPFCEDDPADCPLSPYAASKRAAELVASVYARHSGMDIVCLRFFTVYGPRQRPDMAISHWMRSVQKGMPVQIYGDGRQTRDFTYVGDIIEGIKAALTCPDRLGFQVCNLGSANPVTMREVIQKIAEVTGKVAQVEYRASQAGDAAATFADIRKAARLFGYQPRDSLQSGLENCLDWGLQQSHGTEILQPFATDR